MRTTASTRYSAPRLLLGAAVTGALAVASPTLAVLVAVLAGGVLASVDDVRHRQIPNAVVGGLLGAAAVVGLAELGAGSPRWASMAAGAALAGGTLLALHLISPEGMGFGDVKLAIALGALLGTMHWSLAAVMLLAASSLGSLAALPVNGWRRSMPFGVFLSLGALLAVILQARHPGGIL